MRLLLAPALLSSVLLACVVIGAGCEHRSDGLANCTTPPRGPGIVIAGSGVWVGLARAVTAARAAESIGSSGALKALADGEIDIGLLARPVRDDERWPELVVIPAGHTSYRFIGHKMALPTASQLLKMYAGELSKWPDGTAVRLLAREPGDSGWRLICDRHKALCDAMRAAVAAGRAQVASTDREMKDLLVGAPGAVGPIDSTVLPFDQPRGPGAMRKPLFVIYHGRNRGRYHGRNRGGYRADAPAAVRALAEQLARNARADLD